MIRSMTGFGEAEVETPAGVLRAEVRTVNHRFLSLNIRAPSALDGYEPKLREWLKRDLTRGHVNVAFRLEGQNGEEGPPLTLDIDRARQYQAIFKKLKQELGLAGELSVDVMARFPDIVVRDTEEIPSLDEDLVREATQRAAEAAVAMREREGETLRVDLEERLEAIAAELTVIEERAPERLAAERNRLRNAVAELAGDAGVDEDRLAREVALLADRWDIGEEVVRLRAHIGHFRVLLDEDSAEPVGKRLAFLVQEMHREANTIGSKANDAAIEHRAVAIKNEIERLREQVENVE